jgi:hypothetical protein
MKLSASLVGVLKASSAVSYTQKIASRIEPGQSFEMVDGSRLRVLAKSASPDGLRIRVSSAGSQKTLSLQQFAAIGVVSPAMRRLATFVHRITAFDGALDDYVKEAIKAAGLPVDPTMNWAKYLGKIFNPSLSQITKDPEVINDAITDVVVDELYTKRLLQQDSPYAHFNPDHEKLQGKELASKVTAFLINIFKGRKQQAADTVRRVMGIGAAGSLGLVPAYSTDDTTLNGTIDPSGPVDDYHREMEDDRSRQEFDDIDNEDEIQKFLTGFMSKVSETQRKSTAELLNYISSNYAKGLDKDDIREKFMNDATLKTKYPDKINRQGFLYLMRAWNKQIRDYAKDPKNPLADSDIARLIIRATDKLVDGDSKPSTTASLHLADVEQNGVPTDVPQPPKPPPPPNPNVQQQNAVRQQQNGLNMAPAATGADLNDGQAQQPVNPPKKTITPEIPGVNHTSALTPEQMGGTAELHALGVQENKIRQQTSKAIAEEIAKQKEKGIHVPTPRKSATEVEAPVVAAPVVAAVEAPASDKFASLRQIAADEPQELGLAMSQVTASIRRIASNLHRASINLDLIQPSKTASVREKIAARNQFAAGLRRIAEESPEQIGEVLNDVYAELDRVVTEVENLADHLDVELVAVEPTEEGEASEAEIEPTDESPEDVFPAE